MLDGNLLKCQGRQPHRACRPWPLHSHLQAAAMYSMRVQYIWQYFIVNDCVWQILTIRHTLVRMVLEPGFGHRRHHLHNRFYHFNDTDVHEAPALPRWDSDSQIPFVCDKIGLDVSWFSNQVVIPNHSKPIGQVRADDGEVITKEVHEISGTISPHNYEIWIDLRDSLDPLFPLLCKAYLLFFMRRDISDWETWQQRVKQEDGFNSASISRCLWVLRESTAARTEEAQSISRPEVRWVFLDLMSHERAFLFDVRYNNQNKAFCRSPFVKPEAWPHFVSRQNSAMMPAVESSSRMLGKWPTKYSSNIQATKHWLLDWELKWSSWFSLFPLWLHWISNLPEIWEAVGKKPQPPPPPPPPPNGSGEAWPRLWNMFGTTGICVVSKANQGQDIFRSFYIDIDLFRCWNILDSIWHNIETAHIHTQVQGSLLA